MTENLQSRRLLSPILRGGVMLILCTILSFSSFHAQAQGTTREITVSGVVTDNEGHALI